eukprot:CAMPEP_0197927198 /NCGR_PEP_ID=MMETSP1439-20131203/100364_1 /TAXON_ID=66791 /ORGANISM="Gonyaulax spinifera, Strain CCMP409" /LENGTH=94 /DNA_ID=CAMNT_0043549759 /DNA_START=74 /DNA_END=358 /DNA_ORIENTATION=-
MLDVCLDAIGECRNLAEHHIVVVMEFVEGLEGLPDAACRNPPLPVVLGDAHEFPKHGASLHLGVTWPPLHHLNDQLDGTLTAGRLRDPLVVQRS